MEHERGVHDLLGGRAGRLAVEHGQEVVRGGALARRRDDLLALADAVEGGHERGQLGGEADRLALVGLAAHVLGLVVIGGEHGEGGAHGRHRVGVRRRVVAEVVHEIRVDGARLAHLGRHLVELRLVRHLAVPQEVAGLLEGGVLGQVLDAVAAVEQLALLAVDERELGVERGDAFEASDFLGGGVGLGHWD